MARPGLLLRALVPEMVRMAGGRDDLGREGADSARVAWADALGWEPEMLIVMPCGFDLEETIAHA
jgi:iron complex transport system substrate-binding protein